MPWFGSSKGKTPAATTPEPVAVPAPPAPEGGDPLPPGAYNQDLIGFIPPDARKLVEIGCNTGNLAAAYKKLNPACHYLGFDLNAEAVGLAGRFCDGARQLDIDTADDAFYAGLNDRTCWIFGDVLEHLRAPWDVLAHIRKVLPAGGCVVACIPNAQNWMLQAKLAVGDLRYEDGGLLDRTHLRWFTRATIFELFQGSGFKITGGVPRIFNEPGREAVLPVIRAMAAAVGADPELAVQDSLALQYVVRAEPA